MGDMQSSLVKPAPWRRLPVVTRETGTVGASITGLNVRAEQPPEIQDLMLRALHEHGVLFVRFEGDIEPEDHRRFGSLFGELYDSPFKQGDIPLVSVLDSESLGGYVSTEWHADATALAEPPQAAALRAVMLPEVGGDTMWASMYAAYEALSSKMQRLLEGLEAVHSTDTGRHANSAERQAKIFKEKRTAVHPVVVRDAVTGKPALYVNSKSTERIVGFSDHESRSVLQMLFDHVNTPDFHVRLKWDTRTIAVWEERVTQHRVIKDYVGRRILHRVVVNGSAPAAYADIVH